MQTIYMIVSLERENAALEAGTSQTAEQKKTQSDYSTDRRENQCVTRVKIARTDTADAILPVPSMQSGNHGWNTVTRKRGSIRMHLAFVSADDSELPIIRENREGDIYDQHNRYQG